MDKLSSDWAMNASYHCCHTDIYIFTNNIGFLFKWTDSNSQSYSIFTKAEAGNHSFSRQSLQSQVTSRKRTSACSCISNKDTLHRSLQGDIGNKWVQCNFLGF